MIFYGHRFEDNCCVLRVVVLQGDDAAALRRERGWGKRDFSSPLLSLATYFLECFIIVMKTIYIIQGTTPIPISSSPFPAPEPVLESGSL